jgi:hypothetical protein
MLASLGALCAVAMSAAAQTADPFGKPTIPNGLSVALIPQDSSDCTNSTVQDDPNRIRGGEVVVIRNNDGTTTVQIGMTVAPSTTYHFYLKCVRLLGDIQTDEEGIGLATFTFQTSEVGSTFAFDMYPEGAPPGNKFQSLTVKFP